MTPHMAVTGRFDSYEDAADETRVAPVPVAFNALRSEVSHIDNLLGSLSNALELVLRPVEPKESQTAARPNKPQSPLTDLLVDESTRLCVIAARIEDLLERLEVGRP